MIPPKKDFKDVGKKRRKKEKNCARWLHLHNHRRHNYFNEDCIECRLRSRCKLSTESPKWFAVIHPSRMYRVCMSSFLIVGIDNDGVLASAIDAPRLKCGIDKFKKKYPSSIYLKHNDDNISIQQIIICLYRNSNEERPICIRL
jgi:hypothetical protein